MPANTQLSRLEGQQVDDSAYYRQLVGALKYCTLTRPDVAFAVNKVCQFMHSPTKNHLQVVKRISHYLKGTIQHGLLLQHSNFFDLHAFSDADWASNPDDRWSQSGYCIFLGKSLICWSSKKQPTVSRSSTESEYRSLAAATCELMWLQMLLADLRISQYHPPILWCDNIGTTFLVANPVNYARTKHISMDYHFVREQVANKKLEVRFISSKDRLADTLTKSLCKQSFILSRDKLTVVAPRLSLRGDANIPKIWVCDVAWLSKAYSLYSLYSFQTFLEWSASVYIYAWGYH